MQKTSLAKAYDYRPLAEYFETVCSPGEAAGQLEAAVHFVARNEEKAGLGPSPRLHQNLFGLARALENMEKNN
jgi:hypothetical protein